jgi:hypothetical protein
MHALNSPQAESKPVILLTLEISEPDVVFELQKHAPGQLREKYAQSAIRLGVLALKQAVGEIDATTVRDASKELLGGLEQMLGQRGAAITSDIAGELRQYFDPSTGALPQRIESLLRNDGELDRAMRAHLAPENSTLAKSLSQHFGESSSIFKLLSPNDAGGVKAQVERVLDIALAAQQEQILNEFSLDNKDSALSRLVGELALSNGELKTDLKSQVDRMAGEFSLDKPDSALSRLVERVEAAHQTITNEFSSDNEGSAMARLSRMLQQTSQQIEKNLTLDDDSSTLARLKRELVATIEKLVTGNAVFQEEVRITLATLQARKEEAARSTRHGQTFEDEIGRLIANEAQRLSDPYEATGMTTGAIKNSKIGDFVTVLGPESAAAGTRIVWEAKENRSYTLTRALEEIGEARRNRRAQIGVFVFSQRTAPEGLQPFARYGNDIVIIWDADAPETDLHLRVAYSLARALAIRENHDSVESAQAFREIDLATRGIEKQLTHLDQIKTWAETVKTNGEKVVERVVKMRAELTKEVEALDRQLSGLKTGMARAA